MLRQSEAETIAISYLIKHNLRQSEFTLGSQDWEIQIKSIEQLAQCWHDKKVIVINTKLLDNKTNFEHAVLHEISHALVGPDNNHNEIWKAKARELGCNLDKNCNMNGTEVKSRPHVKPLSSKCPICGSNADETSRVTFSNKIYLRLKCGHLIAKDKIQEVSFDGWTSRTGKKLFPYQIEGCKFIESSNGRCLIADEPGLGKTVQAISFGKFHPEISLPILWVCKTTLKIQAVKEWLDWCDDSYFPCVIDSSKSYIFPNQKVYIISMDLLRRIDPEKLAALDFKTIVADEIQHFKNDRSARTQELRRLVEKVDYFIPLSGTPWKNRGSEYYPVLNMLSPEKFRTEIGFKQRWVDYQYDYKEGKTKEHGIRNIDKFREYTKDFIIRRMRDDVLPDLPKINRQIRYVELESIYGEAYEKAEGKVAEIIKNATLEGSNLNMASLGAEMMKLKHITGLAKVDVAVEDVIEFLEDTEDWQKITLFHHHIDVGDEVEKKLSKWNPLRLRGGIDSNSRNSIVEKFKNDIGSRLLIASTLASGEGLNLQFCQNAIFMERQFNAANEEQAELRFSRPLSIGDLPNYLKHLANAEKVSIRIPYLICANTVDEMLVKLIERKRHNFNVTMNERDKDLKWDENEIIRELAELILSKHYKK